ncbi:1-acyl-sn-glycerol-3-phosphate acyltransferase [Limnohabitans sp.]|uniref:1-acyl-sn-glycerol-3-phosphate acyltransferase n=1 Tax=Limnohabitans sp. TaxID=1907725 RepID=UPI00286F01CF|nr:1-acyl-sn-glycerol-3-phosphate acyltransferase [Limnohabitans sp.]
MSTEFAKPVSVQCKPNRLAAWLVQLMGWKIEFNGLPAKQGVLIGYPHTSNWDFVTMMPIKWAVGLPVQFFAKASLFRIPLFGRWIRFIGAVPIDRSLPQGVVGEMVDALKQHKQDDRLLWIGLSPEGTRKRTEGWRSGFYQLALGADVPLCMLRIDYGNKVAKVTDFMRLTGDVQADYARIAKVYKGVKGFHAHQAAPIRPLPARNAASVNASSTTSLN